MDTLRYPIGQFTALQETNEEQRKQFIESIAGMTDKLRKAVEGLELKQLNTPYRLGGGAKASAAIYSIIETAKENGLHPYEQRIEPIYTTVTSY